MGRNIHPDAIIAITDIVSDDLYIADNVISAKKGTIQIAVLNLDDIAVFVLAIMDFVPADAAPDIWVLNPSTIRYRNATGLFTICIKGIGPVGDIKIAKSQIMTVLDIDGARPGAFDGK